MKLEEREMLRRVLFVWRLNGWRDREGTAISVARALLKSDCTGPMVSARLHHAFLRVNRVRREYVLYHLTPLIEEARHGRPAHH